MLYLPKVPFCSVRFLTLWVYHSLYISYFCHHLVGVHLYKLYRCLDINNICLNQEQLYNCWMLSLLTVQFLPAMPPFSQPCWGCCDRVWTWLWLSGQDVPVSIHQYQGAACCYSDSETLHISCASWTTVVSCCVGGVIDRNNSDCEKERLPFVCWTMMTNCYILQYVLCDCFATQDVCVVHYFLLLLLVSFHSFVDFQLLIFTISSVI